MNGPTVHKVDVRSRNRFIATRKTVFGSRNGSRSASKAKHQERLTLADIARLDEKRAVRNY
jgi:hypothetical protein